MKRVNPRPKENIGLASSLNIKLVLPVHEVNIKNHT